MGRASRDRVTIDLRGLGQRLQTQAAAGKTTTAALVRKALMAQLAEEPPASCSPAHGIDPLTGGQAVKVTLRLSAAHAVALATRARAADVSQGAYVASLIDGTPPSPVPPDRAQAIGALIGSTDRLAAMSTDLNAFMRLLGQASSIELDKYRAGVMSLAADVRRHLATAAPLVAELRSARRGGPPEMLRAQRRTR